MTAISLSAPSAPTKTPHAAAERIHYLDNVRALAMLLGLVFHGGLTYAWPSQNIWLVADWSGDRVIDGLIWFLHIFRMATFFLIAGYFGKLLVERRGVRGFLWNRFLRVVCPFLLFFPFLLAAYIAAVIIAYMPAPELLPPIMAQNKASPPPEQGLNTMHMWFLYYLMIFSAIAAICANVKSKTVDAVADWFYGSFWPTLVAPLAVVPALYFAGAPTGQTESFIPQGWILGYYGLFFLAGWKLWGREGYLDRVSKFVLPLVVACAAMYAGYYYLMPNMLVARTNPASLLNQPPELKLGMALLSAYLSVYLTLISLCLGKMLLSGHSRALRFISDASYWIYLVHLPLMIAIQGLMAPPHWSIWIKFPLSVGLTFLISLGTYAVFVRYTPIGWMLNGYKPIPGDPLGWNQKIARPEAVQVKAS